MKRLLDPETVGPYVAKLRTFAGDPAQVVKNQVMPILMLSCLEWRLGVDPDPSMSGPGVMEYLDDHSRWIMEVFTGIQPVRGEELEVSPGAASAIMARDQAAELRVELERIPAAGDAEVRVEDENMEKIVAAALDRPGLGLLHTIT